MISVQNSSLLKSIAAGDLTRLRMVAPLSLVLLPPKMESKGTQEPLP